MSNIRCDCMDCINIVPDDNNITGTCVWANIYIAEKGICKAYEQFRGQSKYLNENGTAKMKTRGEL